MGKLYVVFLVWSNNSDRHPLLLNKQGIVIVSALIVLTLTFHGAWIINKFCLLLLLVESGRMHTYYGFTADDLIIFYPLLPLVVVPLPAASSSSFALADRNLPTLAHWSLSLWRWVYGEQVSQSHIYFRHHKRLVALAVYLYIVPKNPSESPKNRVAFRKVLRTS